MSDVEIVRKAADYIERVGLHQGMYWDEGAYDPHDSEPIAVSSAAAVERGAKCCSLGAVYGHGGWPETYPGSLENRLQDFVWERHHAAVPTWNDAPGRTADEVVAELRAFADHLEQTTEVQP